MDTEELGIVAGLLVPVLVVVAFVIRRYTWPQAEAALKPIIPDTVEPLVLRAAQVAYEATEQWAKKWGGKTHEERLAQALTYLTGVLEFFRGDGALNDSAREAFMESEVWKRHTIPLLIHAAPVTPAPLTPSPETLPEGALSEAVP